MALTGQHVGAQNTRRRWSCPEFAGNSARGGILERRLDRATERRLTPFGVLQANEAGASGVGGGVDVAGVVGTTTTPNADSGAVVALARGSIAVGE